MIVLALDTCMAACSAAITDGERLIASASEPMTRGHQERLAVMVRDMAAEASVAFDAIERIGVTAGPGSFTGLRVGLAFAKGFALAVGKPCVGIGTLEALAASTPVKGYAAAIIDAGRGRVYLQIFEAGRALTAPDILPLETAAARLAELPDGGEITLIGPGAALLAGAVPSARCIEIAAPAPEVIALLALTAPLVPPRPLYLRAPDATPPTKKFGAR